MKALHDDPAMPGHGHQFTTSSPDLPADGLPEKPSVPDAVLREKAAALAEGWEVLPPAKYETGLPHRLKELTAKLTSTLATAKSRLSGKELTPQLELLESGRMLEAVIASTKSAVPALQKLPHIRLMPHGALPRVNNLAEEYLAAAKGIWSPESLALYVEEVQERHKLLLDEILLIPQALKYAQLEFILDRATEAFAAAELPPIEQSPFSGPIHSLRRLNQFEWRYLLESLTSFDATLRADPADAFSGMEDETRNSYQMRVAQLAANADFSELETAEAALALARRAQSDGDVDPRRGRRVQHIGYYLFAEGLPDLRERIGYHAPLSERLREIVRKHADYIYVLGIVTLSVVLILPIIAPLVPHHAFWPVMGALLLALLPVTQGAVDMINGLVSSLLKAEALPKMDFAKAVPSDATTLVVVPTLLLRERQVQELFEDLEARYLSNEDANIHFALLTDFPDSIAQPSPDERHPLVQMAIQYTANLNTKYSDGKGGGFLLLHRHRVFNARQGVWMGWERKRGKLLDLNKLLLREFDSFPIKAGPLHILEKVRYVITLDSDTQLPRATASRMIGTMAHPLNCAIINPRKKIVTAGYGILQPRVGVSVASASRSHLSAIYSGETGFDIYTRAVSDVYQDLFGEGIFTGKGIYEVSVLHQVLERRFPKNALLSHDLIEGAYVRAGLVTDVEVIDDYPSQYHAHTRRKHRWIRGDWQIMRWLFLSVPDESGRLVPNPISFISQWKILDNLRRSLVEPFTFLILLLGCFFLPGGALYWTIITITLLAIPALVQLGFDLIRAFVGLSATAVRGAFSTFFGSIAFVLINLTFLAHQMMLSIDAIVRTLIRSFFSGRRMLEWETAAQSESSANRNSLDIYLQLSPVLALVIAGALAVHHRHALLAAGPVLFLWLIAPFAAKWLNSSPRAAERTLSLADRSFLERQALLLWRFYAEFGGAENHWLIPDNVEERDRLQVRKLSPTNLGMLLNARQAACELGFLTLPEFVEVTTGTLTTYERLEKYRGHIYNWYDIETLQAVPPFTVSAVDSGNLAASLYTLHTGSLDLLKRPMLSSESFLALDRIIPKQNETPLESGDLRTHLQELFSSTQLEIDGGSDEDTWIHCELDRRRAALTSLVTSYLPWLLPEFSSLVEASIEGTKDIPSVEHAEAHLQSLSIALEKLDGDPLLGEKARTLRSLLPEAIVKATRLERELKSIIDGAERFAEEMDYSFLFVESRQLLSIGYDGRTHELHSACYDLLASEARIASFLAVAKGDIPQQAWFRLDRSHVLVKGRPALVSWTGTMFEYMMPALWMRTFPNTLLSNSLESAVRIQMEHVRKIPWGISESGFAQTDDAGRYGYQAWGIPKLALKYGAEDGPVISPYSTFLALPILRKEALVNLRRMASMGWTGAYGFYEAADYTEGSEPRLVRSWMAHHQGMALLAVTNLLRLNIFQTWFHANPRVRAAELLLHEKALSKQTLNELAKRKPSEAA